jgi:hypothetical protein
LAIVAKPTAMSSGETSADPVASEATGGRSEVTPIFSATGGTVSGPMSRMSWAKTTLIESSVAVHRSTLPLPLPSAFSTQWSTSSHKGLQNGEVLE